MTGKQEQAPAFSTESCPACLPVLTPLCGDLAFPLVLTATKPYLGIFALVVSTAFQAVPSPCLSSQTSWGCFHHSFQHTCSLLGKVLPDHPCEVACVFLLFLWHPFVVFL